jgi:charged multivesicular body protein 6
MGNWLSSLFSSPNNSKNNKDHQITAYDRAILDLKIQRDKLKQFSKKVQYFFDNLSVDFVDVCVWFFCAIMNLCFRFTMMKLESVLAREKEVARQLLREGKQNLARLCLRKKRFQEQLLERLSVHLANLEQLVDTLEFSIIEKKVFDGLKEGNEVLKKIQQEMSVEAVEELLLDTQNAIQHQKVKFIFTSDAHTHTHSLTLSHTHSPLDIVFCCY